MLAAQKEKSCRVLTARKIPMDTGYPKILGLTWNELAQKWSSNLLVKLPMHLAQGFGCCSQCLFRIVLQKIARNRLEANNWRYLINKTQIDTWRLYSCRNDILVVLEMVLSILQDLTVIRLDVPVRAAKNQNQSSSSSSSRGRYTGASRAEQFGADELFFEGFCLQSWHQICRKMHSFFPGQRSVPKTLRHVQTKTGLVSQTPRVWDPPHSSPSGPRPRPVVGWHNKSSDFCWGCCHHCAEALR